MSTQNHIEHTELLYIYGRLSVHDENHSLTCIKAIMDAMGDPGATVGDVLRAIKRKDTP